MGSIVLRLRIASEATVQNFVIGRNGWSHQVAEDETIGGFLTTFSFMAKPCPSDDTNLSDRFAFLDS